MRSATGRAPPTGAVGVNHGVFGGAFFHPGAVTTSRMAGKSLLENQPAIILLAPCGFPPALITWPGGIEGRGVSNHIRRRRVSIEPGHGEDDCDLMCCRRQGMLDKLAQQG